MKMRAMMRCVAVLLGVMVCGAAVEVVESGSATIRSDQIDWNENASGASVNHLFVRRGEVGATRQLVLWRFDLSRCRGMSVTGDCMLSAGVAWAGMEAPFVLYEVSKPWQEASVTWSTLVGANGDHAEVLGTALATQPIGPVQGKPVVYWWRIPQATAQRWLDAPEKFHGVAVVAQQACTACPCGAVPTFLRLPKYVFHRHLTFPARYVILVPSWPAAPTQPAC